MPTIDFSEKITKGYASVGIEVNPEWCREREKNIMWPGHSGPKKLSVKKKIQSNLCYTSVSFDIGYYSAAFNYKLAIKESFTLSANSEWLSDNSQSL